MTSLSTDFTDKLFAEYEANAKYSAIENAVTHNGLLKSIETRQSEVENDHVFSTIVYPFFLYCAVQFVNSEGFGRA